MKSVMAIFDTKAGMFHAPWFAPTVAAGKRDFSGIVNDPSSVVGKYPEDFVLFGFGTFDDSTGTFELENQPENFGNGVLYILKKEG